MHCHCANHHGRLKWFCNALLSAFHSYLVIAHSRDSIYVLYSLVNNAEQSAEWFLNYYVPSFKFFNSLCIPSFGKLVSEPWTLQCSICLLSLVWGPLPHVLGVIFFVISYGSLFTGNSSLRVSLRLNSPPIAKMFQALPPSSRLVPPEFSSFWW